MRLRYPRRLLGSYRQLSIPAGPIEANTSSLVATSIAFFQYPQVRLRQLYYGNSRTFLFIFQYPQVRLRLNSFWSGHLSGSNFQYPQVRLRRIAEGGLSQEPQLSIPAGPIEARKRSTPPLSISSFQYPQVRLRRRSAICFASLLSTFNTRRSD